MLSDEVLELRKRLDDVQIAHGRKEAELSETEGRLEEAMSRLALSQQACEELREQVTLKLTTHGLLLQLQQPIGY